MHSQMLQRGLNRFNPFISTLLVDTEVRCILSRCGPVSMRAQSYVAGGRRDPHCARSIAKLSSRRAAWPVTRDGYFERKIRVERAADRTHLHIRAQAPRYVYFHVPACGCKDQFSCPVELVQFAGNVAARGPG